VPEKVKWRDYKEYEKERFLRWFGTDYVPALDLDNITKKTLCSIPKMSNDIQSDTFSEDARNLISETSDLTRANIDNSTSQSLLSLATKSTLNVINKDDGQYLRMVVSGHQQTAGVAFHLTGKMQNVIQDMNHYANTWMLIQKAYQCICLEMLFLNVTTTLAPNVVQIWDKIGQYMGDDDDYIPKDWYTIKSYLEPLQTPTFLDLLRFRQLDIETIIEKVNYQMLKRRAFLLGISDKRNRLEEDSDGEWTEIEDSYYSREEFLRLFINDEDLITQLKNMLGDIIYYNTYLDHYIYKYMEDDNQDKPMWYANIPLAEEQIKVLIIEPLDRIYGRSYTADEIEERKKYNVSFDDVTVDELRTTIMTLNTLIVRLPTDTYQNKIASRHIFQDWKKFVDGSVKKMVANGEKYLNPETTPEEKEELEPKCLFVEWETKDGKRVWKTETGNGTDGLPHPYTELYVDSLKTEKLIDYSYCIEEGKVVHDRWDYWEANKDFKRPE